MKDFTTKAELTRADGLLFMTVMFWGINFSVVKFALAGFPPLIFNSIRFFIASAIMFIVARAAGDTFRFQRRHLPYLLGVGFIGNTTYQLLFVFGVDNTTADNSSLILATVPAWVALFGTLAGVERISTRGWLGVGLSLLGILLIITGSNHQVELQFGGATLHGDLLILLATLCWSVYTLISRPMMRHYSSAMVTSFSTLLGAIPLVLIAIPGMIEFEWAGVAPSAWVAVFLSGTFGIALAYIFWNNGVSKLGSARTSLYSNLVPSIALLTAWVWLGETLTVQQWGGVILALIGVTLARRHARPVTIQPMGE